MFRSLFRSDASDRSPWGSFWFSSIGSLTGSGVRVNADTAMQLTTVYACARVLSESFALLPFRLYRPRIGGGRQQVQDHWLYSLFARRPNRWQTPFEWREMLQGHLALRGNAFCQIVEDGQGGIAELLPMHPDRISVEMTDDDYGFRYRYVKRGGETVFLARQQVWHLRGLSGDGVVGYNPIEVAREAIGEALQFQSYSARFYANNATPPFWIKYPGKIADKTARDNLRSSIQDATGGSNRGKAMVLDQGLELQPLNINQRDMQFIEARKMKATDVAQLFRVPPHKVGLLERSTNNNIEQQAIEFWTDTMQPYAERWESSAECSLLGEDTDLEVEFDMRAQMRGDSTARAAYISNGVNAGWLTRNEGRGMEGLDPLDGLDEPLVPVNLREESEPDPNAKQGQDDQSSAPPAEEDASEKDARLASLLRGNADRMARRLAKGETVAAPVLAEALAIEESVALDWLARCTGLRLNESDYSALLMALGSTK
jgi:HK97 family phage portal protein